MPIAIELFPQQVEGSEYIIKHLGGCLWMDMRTGKTLTTLQVLSILELFPALVLGPGHVFQGWEDQIVMAGGDLENTQRLEGTAKQIVKKIKSPKAVNFMNYSQAWRRDVLQYEWKAIILDESTKVSNLDTKISFYIFNNAQNNSDALKMCLSGSPAPNELIQLVSQHYWQRNGEIFGYKGPKGFDEYIAKYWKLDERKNVFKVRKASHRKALLAWNAENSFRCTMKDIGRDSLLCHRTSFVEPSEEVKSRINSLRIGEIYKSRTTGKMVPLNPMVKAVFEMSLCAGRDPRTGEVFDLAKQDHILNEWDPKDKIPFLVVGFLKEPLKAMVDLFRQRGGKCEYVDATTGNREQVIRDFREGKLDAFFAQMDAIKEGVDASRADKLFVLNNSFSPDTRNQIVMRCTSLNKDTPTEVIDVVHKGCYEVSLVEKLANKKRMSDEVVQKDYAAFDGKLLK